MPQMHDDVRGACAEPKASLDAYEWDELKQIARAIAAASCRTEGLAIARDFRLVDDEFRLTGDTKRVMLEDGTTASVRILGFRHDKLANGAGKAGVSFEFADVPVRHRMNVRATNEGGWYKSEMRGWLNSAFFGMLPHDLSANIVEVKKRASYRDWDGERGGVPLHGIWAMLRLNTGRSARP